MAGYLALVLHAHLPFVRHPEHPRFLEETWLFEAVVETYIPLLRLLEQWREEHLPARLCFTLSPTLCAMLRDPLLQERCARHIDDLLDLAEKEVLRTTFDPATQRVARFYEERLQATRDFYLKHHCDLASRFRAAQDAGQIEIITCAATHAVLPLLADDPPAVRAQLAAARDEYVRCFGRLPHGIWLPECAFEARLEPLLAEAGFHWFLVDTHGLLNATPPPRFKTFAPVFTPHGLGVFGRDPESARQVWSRHGGYPGDFRYREFYRDIGFDLDFDYVRAHLAAPERRGFTGLKYHAITGPGPDKNLYDRAAALDAAATHARHFLDARATHCAQVHPALDRPPILVCPYDAELFGHWWFEGPEFLDALVRLAARDNTIRLITPGDYLAAHPINQMAMPAPSSWGEGGYLKVWLNESNHWIQPKLREAQIQLTAAVNHAPQPLPDLQRRALAQAGRELLLAQSSDWPFILRTQSSPEYARNRVLNHLDYFARLLSQTENQTIDLDFLSSLEARNNIFPGLNPLWWRG